MSLGKEEKKDLAMAFVGTSLTVGQGYSSVMYSMSSSSNTVMTSSNSWQGSLNTTGASNGPVLYQCVKPGIAGTRMITQWKSQTALLPTTDSEFSIFDEQSSRISEIR